jgi:Cytidylate kinase-like family
MFSSTCHSKKRSGGSRRGGKSRHEAAQLTETVDRDRAAFIMQYFGVEWPDRRRFHLMVNSTIGKEAVVETVLHTLDKDDGVRTPGPSLRWTIGKSASRATLDATSSRRMRLSDAQYRIGCAAVLESQIANGRYDPS